MFKIRELIPWVLAAAFGIGVVLAAQTNYLGTVFIADSTTPANQLTINSSGAALTSATGNVASGATDSGNPVKVGGVYNSTLPTVTTGQRVDLQADRNGNMRAKMVGTAYAGADGIVASNAFAGVVGRDVDDTPRALVVGPLNFNGTTSDRQRNNIDGTGLASAARTTTTNSGDITNYNGTGVHVVLDVTNAGTGSITLTIQGKDALSGQYYTLLAGAAVTTVSTNVYKVFPGSTVTANVSANDICPRTIRILVTHNNANSITYSVGYSLIL